MITLLEYHVQQLEEMERREPHLKRKAKAMWNSPFTSTWAVKTVNAVETWCKLSNLILLDFRSEIEEARASAITINKETNHNAE